MRFSHERRGRFICGIFSCGAIGGERGSGRRRSRSCREEIWPRDVRLTVAALCRNPGGVDFWRSVGYRDYCVTLEILPP
jgi:hypothetical protein